MGVDKKIDVKEFRVGNLVLAGIMTEPITVFTIGFDMQEGVIINKHIPIDDIHPIPLTPKVLVACGFELWDSDKESGIIRFNKKHSDSKDFLIFLYNKIGKYEFCIDCDDFSKLLTEISFLHQLQNLYYALTQTELTYNP